MEYHDKIKKTVIITGYKCNNKCKFCLDEDKRNLPDKTTQQIMQEMINSKQRGTTYLELIGGESTIRNDIVRLIGFAKKLGFDTIAMATNGRMFSYENFAKNIVEAGLTDLIFSIHGHNAQLHDSLTRSKGSFEQLKMGFENMKKLLDLRRIGSNTTIVKQNYKKLRQIGEMIYQMGIRNSEFIFVDPTYGAAYRNFKKYVPKISEIAPYVRQCLDIKKENKEIFHWTIRYVPLCYFEDNLEQVSELDEVKRFQSEHLAPDYQNFDVEGSRAIVGRAKPKRCQKCKLHNKCEGIWKEYLKHYGDSELKPIKK